MVRPTDQIDVNEVLAGGGEMGARMRSIDWSATPLGSVRGWSQALRTTVGLLLRNRFPILLWWGPRYVQFYNDAYVPIPGDKHPKALGQPADECWAEIWHIIGPMVEAPFSGGAATWSDDLFLLINRKGFLEETHFKVAYSPVPDDTVRPTGVGGVLATVAETTEQVYGERQLKTLRELGARAAEAKTPSQACETAAATLGYNALDVPFALFYLIEPDGKRARLSSSCGFDREDGPANPSFIELEPPEERRWPVSRVVNNRSVEVLSELPAELGSLPGGRWSQSPRSAIALPLLSPDQAQPYGVLIAGCSPHRALDDGYRTFFELAAAQVITAIRNANAYEEQRLRAEKLAELDRAKTVFFSNVSHEFRTPLTLMLGPTEDLLSGVHGELTGLQREQLELMHRSELRLQRLVNALLDFSRIEAGRIQASYQPVDLARITRDLASSFRSAAERAGLAFVVDCVPLREPTFVDADMWEQIVLNLLSNALKFTFEGEIVVSLHASDESVVLRVKDTGTGVRSEDVPRLFERFYRVEGARARTHEGSGIGLALVQELVRLHGGTVRVDSSYGAGTVFTVAIPKGSKHLPRERIGASPILAPTRTGPIAFVEEALRWLPTEAPGLEAPTGRARILVADDNADMRDYLRRILEQRWTIETVTDGAAALEAVRARPPDLILSDVMMPLLDGFGLLAKLRAAASTRTIPVIMLSARAGEESRVDGLEAGADDYLIKPFSARELVARIETHLELARQRLEAVRTAADLKDAMMTRDDFLSLASHELRTPLTTLGLHADNLIRELKSAERDDLRLDQLMHTGAKIRDQASRMEALIENMLGAFTASEDLELHLERIDLASVVRGVVDRISGESKESNTAINLRAEPIVGMWDRARLDRVLTELVANALKFGEGKLVDVSIRASDSQDHARIVVRDRGIGIRPEDQERIFGRFERAVPPQQYGGFGLGLWVTRALVHAMRGTVQVDSQPLNGAAFTVELPWHR